MRVARAAFYLTCGSAVGIFFSIAISQILLGLALAAVLISGLPMRFTPVKLPLAIYIGWTLLAVLVSTDPKAGTPQIRKLILFFSLLLVLSTIRTLAELRVVLLAGTCVLTLSAVVSLFQFWAKIQKAKALHVSWYGYYIPERITGFTSHWMTLGGEEMIMLMLLLSFLFFSRTTTWKPLGWICAAIISLSLVLGMTRSIFLRSEEHT